MAQRGSKVTNIGPDQLETIADTALSTSAAVIVAADPNRDHAIITNNDASIAIRVGDSNTSTTRGARVSAEQSVTIFGTMAIYAASESGTPDVGITTATYAP